MWRDHAQIDRSTAPPPASIVSRVPRPNSVVVSESRAPGRYAAEQRSADDAAGCAAASRRTRKAAAVAARARQTSDLSDRNSIGFSEQRRHAPHGSEDGITPKV